MQNNFNMPVIFQGRVYPDLIRKAVFMNWTCTGFRCTFIGKHLRAKLLGISEKANGGETELEHPYLGITVGDGGDLVKRVCVTPGENWYTLYESEEEAQHTVTVWKLSENFRGKVGLIGLDTDGQLLHQNAHEPELAIEFIGDSITCGYGNEASHRDDPFKPEEENGYMSFAMRASRELHAQASCISVSGISVALDPDRKFPMGIPGMEDLYPYTDRPYEERTGKTEFTPWDFDSYPVDAVVINLGTNDVNALKLANNLEERGDASQFFKNRYMEFIKTIRRFRGTKPFILCTLGPLDYYLYEEIRDVVDAYKAETGDVKIDTFKFGGVILWSEGFGAVGHPSAKTHERMGRELAAKLRQCLKLEE